LKNGIIMFNFSFGDLEEVKARNPVRGYHIFYNPELGLSVKLGVRKLGLSFTKKTRIVDMILPPLKREKYVQHKFQIFSAGEKMA